MKLVTVTVKTSPEGEVKIISKIGATVKRKGGYRYIDCLGQVPHPEWWSDPKHPNGEGCYKPGWSFGARVTLPPLMKSDEVDYIVCPGGVGHVHSLEFRSEELHGPPPIAFPELLVFLNGDYSFDDAPLAGCIPFEELDIRMLAGRGPRVALQCHKGILEYVVNPPHSPESWLWEKVTQK